MVIEGMVKVRTEKGLIELSESEFFDKYIKLRWYNWKEKVYWERYSKNFLQIVFNVIKK